MYYDITIFSQFVVAPTGRIVNAMGRKIFPNTIVLFWVDVTKNYNLIITITNLKIA